MTRATSTHRDYSVKAVEPAHRSSQRAVSEIVPRAIVDADALSYHLLRPKSAGPADLPLLCEAYRCWSEVWRQTFLELDNQPSLPSDDFTRQDEVGALFHNYECIGLSFFRWVDLSSPLARDDSYFAVWPEAARAAATKDGSRVCVSSSFTIAAPWRRASGCSLKDVLVALIIERFLLSDADVLLGTVRNNRGVNLVVYRNGFQPLHHNAILHGVEVDLTAFYRKSSVRTPTGELDEQVVMSVRPRQIHSERSE
jgi:hypothetical protein